MFSILFIIIKCIYVLFNFKRYLFYFKLRQFLIRPLAATFFSRGLGHVLSLCPASFFNLSLSESPETLVSAFVSLWVQPNLSHSTFCFTPNHSPSRRTPPWERHTPVPKGKRCGCWLLLSWLTPSFWSNNTCICFIKRRRALTRQYRRSFLALKLLFRVSRYKITAFTLASTPLVL